MAKGKKSFVLYSDQKELFEHITEEQAGKLIKHIFKYVNDENPTCDDPIVNLAFITIKASLKRDLASWEEKIKQRSEAGKKSAQKRRATKSNENKQPLTSVESRARKATDNVNDNVNVNDNNKKGVPPSFDEFLNHARKKAKEKNIYLDEEKVKTKFYSWLENDWCDMNGSKILNWKVKITSNINYWQGVKPAVTNNGFQKLIF